MPLSGVSEADATHGRQAKAVSQTEAEAATRSPSDDSRRLAPLCQSAVNWSCEPRPGCVVGFLVSQKGSPLLTLFLCLNQGPSSYPQDDVVSESKWKVKTSDLTKVVKYGSWHQANGLTYFLLSLLFLMLFIG